MRKLGLVVETEGQYRAHFFDEFNKFVEGFRVMARNDENKIVKLRVENHELKKELRSVKTDRTQLAKFACAIRDIKMSEQIEHMIKGLQERNDAMDRADLDIVVKAPLTADGIIKALNNLLGDVHKTGVDRRRVAKG